MGARIRAVIALGLGVTSACAAVKPSAPRPSAPPSASTSAVVAAEPSRSPLSDAFGLYFDPAGRLQVFLLELDGRAFYVERGIAAAAQAQPVADGFHLTIREPDSYERGEDPLPTSIALKRPVPGDNRWRLGDGPYLIQWRDAWSDRLMAVQRRDELRGLDLEGLEARRRLRDYLRLLRERPAAGLAAAVSDIDPAVVQARGGALAFVADQLGFVLDSLKESTTAAEAARLANYESALASVRRGVATLWPPDDDAFLSELTKRRWPGPGTLRIHDGAWLTASTVFPRDKNPGCDLALLLPDVTNNGEHEPRAFRPPVGERVGAFPYFGLVFQRGKPGECDKLAPGRDVYRVQHGVYFLRLFADAAGAISGAQAVGYMSSALFVAPSIDDVALSTLLRAQGDEISRQAE